MNLRIRFITVFLLAFGAFHFGFAQMGSMLRNDSGGGPFISTWNTNLTSAGSTGNNVVQLPLPAGGNYAFSVDWGDGSNGTVTNGTLANATHVYGAPGTYTITINGLIEGWQFDNTGDRTKIIDVSQWGVLRGAGNDAFYGCSNLDVSAIDQLNVTGITDFSNQFRGCSSLTGMEVSTWNLASGTDFQNQFLGCSSLVALDVSNWDVSSGFRFNRQFQNCSSLATLNVSNWDVSSAEFMAFQFANCTAINGLDVSSWNVAINRDFASQFRNCSSLTSLDVSNWNTSQARAMFSMFQNCSSLTALDVSGWDTSLVADFNSMFDNCTALTSLNPNGWDVSSATNFDATFRNCTGIETQLNFSAWDVRNVLRFGGFCDGITLTPANYAATLNHFAEPTANGGLEDAATFPPPIPSQSTPGIIGFGNSQYPASALADRNTISITKSWVLTDGGPI